MQDFCITNQRGGYHLLNMLLMDIKQRDLRNYKWVDTVPGLPGLVFQEIQDYGMAPAHRLWGHQQWHSTVIVIN
jgi:hypothetical protein